MVEDKEAETVGEKVMEKLPVCVAEPVELELRLTESVSEKLKLAELLGDADGLSVTELD